MKFICRKCTPERPCILDVEAESGFPFSCPFDSSSQSQKVDWKALGVSCSDEFEMQGICADCSRNDETCSMCPSCRGGDNFEPKGIVANAESITEKSCHTAASAKDPKARYYDAGGVEVLDVIKAKLTAEQFKGWLLGNLIKYSCRANHKGQFARDVEKVSFYSGELFGFLEE